MSAFLCGSAAKCYPIAFASNPVGVTDPMRNPATQLFVEKADLQTYVICKISVEHLTYLRISTTLGDRSEVVRLRGHSELISSQTGVDRFCR